MTDEHKSVAGLNADNDFIDEIAILLPPEQRPLWYRDMAHLRRLPADDELLRIARAMGFLALITRQAPVEIASEREKLAASVHDAVTSIEALRNDTAKFHHEIANRLAKLPNEIAEGVNPISIAAILAESLRQQFIQSGLPETTRALALIAKQSEQAATQFGCSCKQVNETCRNTTKDFLDSLRGMSTMIQITSEEAKEATQCLRQTFLRGYTWSVLTLCAVALMLGFSLGIVWQHWREKPAQVAASVPAASQQAGAGGHAVTTDVSASRLRSHPRPVHETTK